MKLSALLGHVPSRELWRLFVYVIAAAGGALAAALAVALISWGGFVYGLVPGWDGELLRYQVRKLEAAASADVVLLGDSSLGNAIDARRWSEQLGHPVLSLALSGDFGYAGSLNMLRRVLRRWTPKLVVVMHTADITTRSTPYWSALVTAETLQDIDAATIVPGLFQLYRSHAIVDLLVRRGGPEIDPDAALRARDYVQQGLSLLVSGRQLESHARLLRRKVHAENRPFLTAIADLCRDHEVTCVYMSGPLVVPLCSESVPRVRATDALVTASGLEAVAGSPLCIPLADVGDTEDHVAPPARARFSDRYLELLRKTGALAVLDDGRGTRLSSATGDVEMALRGNPMRPVDGEPPS